MSRVKIALPGHEYDVIIEAGALSRLGEFVSAHAPHDRCALLMDGTVAGHHGGAARGSLEQAGFRVSIGEIEAGEQHKSLGTIERLYQVLLDDRLERRSPVVALGGGVTGDMAGFVAATYLRGVPFVQCPTTLLAMVDSSVGGKTGVNVPQGKNLIGAFYQPVTVVIDPEVLRTLPARELRCGIAECIKHGVLADAEVFRFTADHMDSILALEMDTLTELVRRNVEIKARVVMEDEREQGIRAHLNLGHTFGHAIEATSGYGHFLHGEAVALGMLAAARTSIEFGLCGEDLLEELAPAVASAGLPTRAPLASDEALFEAMRHDKKVIDDRIRLVLPDRLGHVVIRDDVPEACVRAGWAEIRE